MMLALLGRGLAAWLFGTPGIRQTPTGELLGPQTGHSSAEDDEQSMKKALISRAFLSSGGRI
jgi:hypothetical protein